MSLRGDVMNYTNIAINNMLLYSQHHSAGIPPYTLVFSDVLALVLLAIILFGITVYFASRI